jgi:hypothetical protein
LKPRLRKIGREKCDEARAFDGLGRCTDGEPVFLGLRRGLAARPQPYDDIEPRVAQVERVRTPLAAISEHRDALACERIGLHIIFRVELHHLPLGSIE